MARKQAREDVAFIVEYEDGTTAFMAVDRFTLRSGDHVVRIIAREWQQGGRLPEGKIVNIKRAPS